ncbi:hypothetical protein BDZ91DRAFT_718352, partial [Kalaharituber pfeilii]
MSPNTDKLCDEESTCRWKDVQEKWIETDRDYVRKYGKSAGRVFLDGLMGSMKGGSWLSRVLSPDSAGSSRVAHGPALGSRLRGVTLSGYQKLNEEGMNMQMRGEGAVDGAVSGRMAQLIPPPPLPSQRHRLPRLSAENLQNVDTNEDRARDVGSGCRNSPRGSTGDYNCKRGGDIEVGL